MASSSLLRRVCRELLAFEWFWLLLLLPAAVFPSPVRSLALVVIPILMLARKIAFGRFLPSTPLDLTLLLFYLMVGVGISVSADMSFTVPKAIGLAYGAAVFYAVVAGVRGSVRNLVYAILLFLAGGAAAAVLGLSAVRWSSVKLPVLQGVAVRLPQRLIELPGAPEGVSPNQLAGTLLWCIPVALALALASIVWGRSLRPHFSKGQWMGFLVVIWGSTLLQGTALLLTQSRSGLIGLAAALLFVFVLVFWRFRRLMAVLLVVALAVVILLGINEGWRQTADRLAGTGSELLVTNFDDTVSTIEFRLAVWNRALQGIRDFPITGSGLGTFRQVQPILYPFFNMKSEGDIAHAHNHWLQTALDIGVPGLTAYLAIWLVGIGLIWRVGHRFDGWNRALAVGFAGSFLAYSVFGLMDAVAVGAKPGFLWWMLLGLIVAVYQMPQPYIELVENRPSSRASGRDDGLAFDR